MPQPNDPLGPYVLLKYLGRGQFGEVWKAQKREGIAPPCAIKLPIGDEIKWADVEKEARVWMQASGHPNVLPMIEATSYDGQIVLVSEYAADGSLLDWLKKHDGKAPSVAKAIELVSGILSGLEHLHTRNIVHRDLKPANVLLQGEIPRLADFGLSRVLSSTQSSVLAGTPAYMSPEALDSDEERTVQTDIWAVGVILYQLLTGRLPFPQRQQGSLIKAILNDPPQPLPMELPEPLRTVVLCALQRDLSQRYKSATAMKQELQGCLTAPLQPAPQPKPAPPPSPRIQVPLRAEPRVPVRKQNSGRNVLLTLGGVAVLATGIGLGLWQRTPPDTPVEPTPTPTIVTSATPRRTNNTPPPVASSSLIEDLGNGVELELVRVPGGSFQMGSENGQDDEKPVHRVTISAFEMGKYEVTQAQWQAVMGTSVRQQRDKANTSWALYGEGADYPMYYVSWEEAQEFCRRLSQRTGKTYRLPTEAEWEYACRAGTTGDYAGNLDAMAWYSNNSNSQTHPAGQKQPNKWGLYDMHGNVWEWCRDWYDSNYYRQSPGTDPQGPSGGSYRVTRGGSWFNYADYCRAAYRSDDSPGFRDYDLGFRLVRQDR